MIRYRSFIALIVFSQCLVSTLLAQEKELVVTYKFERSQLSLGGENFNEIQRSAFPIHNVKVYTFQDCSIRETEPLVTTAYLQSGESLPPDTTYNYIKIDYRESLLFEPVFMYINEIGSSDYKMLLKEQLNSFNWTLTKETKTILGYQCYLAKCNFRGRDYLAYFTIDIPFKAAPWKFYGLPGVVLEVGSEDDMFRWTALSLKIKPGKTEIELPYVGMETIDLIQYKKLLTEIEKSVIEGRKIAALRFPDSPSYSLESLKLKNEIEIFDLDVEYK